MPSITSTFTPRMADGQALPVPHNSMNFALVSQFAEIPQDVLLTMEYTVHAAQMAVY